MPDGSPSALHQCSTVTFVCGCRQACVSRLSAYHNTVVPARITCYKSVTDRAGTGCGAGNYVTRADLSSACVRTNLHGCSACSYEGLSSVYLLRIISLKSCSRGSVFVQPMCGGLSIVRCPQRSQGESQGDAVDRAAAPASLPAVRWRQPHDAVGGHRAVRPGPAKGRPPAVPPSGRCGAAMRIALLCWIPRTLGLDMRCRRAMRGPSRVVTANERPRHASPRPQSQKDPCRRQGTSPDQVCWLIKPSRSPV